jgi:NAD+ synthase (glutamine-hydrolysing)
MRIALAQIDPIVGDIEGNAARVRARTEEARRQGAGLVVFPELCLSGYPPRDFLDMPEFLTRVERALADLARPAPWSREIAIAVGFPERAAGGPPPGVYNSVALIAGGKVAAVGRKSLLPSYDVFDETRHFLPAPSPTVASAPDGGKPLGLSICEDIWNDKRFWDRPRYARDPIAELKEAGAGLVLNLSASPYAQGKRRLREEMIGAAARSHGTAIAYVNQVGGNDSLVFDGGSMLVGRDGKVIARAPAFEETLLLCDLDGGGPLAPAPAGDPDALADEVLAALSLGVSDYVRKCGFARVVVGLSGGIDSALVACIAAQALGPGNVLGVAMPSRYSSDHSREDARAVAKSMGITFQEIPIEPMHAATLSVLEKALGGDLNDLAGQNVQARIRGQILMALSNQLGGMVLSTGNKSELAVGYCTLYGDMAGGLCAIGDVPKTQVYALARRINARARREVIPRRTLEKPPSAELKPGQTDQDTLPPYDVLDAILAAYVEERLGLEEIVARGHDRETVRRVLNMVVATEYKRRQAAPVIKVSAKAFGEGRRFPIAQGYRY